MNLNTFVACLASTGPVHLTNLLRLTLQHSRQLHHDPSDEWHAKHAAVVEEMVRRVNYAGTLQPLRPGGEPDPSLDRYPSEWQVRGLFDRLRSVASAIDEACLADRDQPESAERLRRIRRLHADIILCLIPGTLPEQFDSGFSGPPPAASNELHRQWSLVSINEAVLGRRLFLTRTETRSMGDGYRATYSAGFGEAEVVKVGTPVDAHSQHVLVQFLQLPAIGDQPQKELS